MQINICWEKTIICMNGKKISFFFFTDEQHIQSVNENTLSQLYTHINIFKKSLKKKSI